MRKALTRVRWWKLAATLTGGTLLLSGCDPETRAAVENGIIDTSTGFVSAFLQALIQLAGEQNDQTAQLMIDSAIRLCA